VEKKYAAALDSTAGPTAFAGGGCDKRDGFRYTTPVPAVTKTAARINRMARRARGLRRAFPVVVFISLI
jgi:hypothetical protein